MTNRYDLIGTIQWLATAPETSPICPERLNPLITQLTEELQKYIFEKDTLKAVLIDLDDPYNLGFTKTRCQGGWDICHFDVIDRSNSDEVRCHNFNNKIRPALINELLKFEFSHYKTSLKIAKVTLP